MERCGTYELLELVGTGSSGQVYHGRPEAGGDEVAIKVLGKSTPPGLSALTAKLKALNHPRLCQLHAVGEDSQRGTFLVYRYVAGQDLESARQGFEGGKVPLRTALGWIRDTLKGLIVLHNAGLIHGDLKPSNLMLDQKQRVVVCDLTSVIPLQGKLESDPKSGTPAYLPKDESLLRTPARDLYALGLTLTGLLIGRLPEPDEEIVPSQMDPLLGSAVDDLVARSLGPDARFSSAFEMLSAVEKLLGIGPETSPSSTNLSPPTRRVELQKSPLKLALWPWLIALLMLPLGMLARENFAPPQSKVESTALWTGISIKPRVYRRHRLWQTTILGRPVVTFAGADELFGEESGASRAAWCAAVLEEAHFRSRPLSFEYRKEFPDSSEVWLVGEDLEPKFLFRVTPTESKLFDRPGPALARYWSALLQDTAELARPGARRGERAPSALLLKPWTRRFETLTADQPEPGQRERVRLYVKALYSLEEELRDEILESTLNPPQEKEEKET